MPGKLAICMVRHDQATLLTEMRATFQSLMLFVSSELHKEYTPFVLDFGPTNLSVVYCIYKAFHKRLSEDFMTVY